MSDYISREAALEAANEWVSEACMAPVMRVSRLLDKLAKVPAADVAEVRHGRWIDGVCSECGFDAMYYKGIPAQVYTDYCPSCGARMDKEDEHEVS